MAPVEDRQRRFSALWIDLAQAVEFFGHAGGFGLEFRRLGLEHLFLDRAGQIGVEESVLHRRQFGLAFDQRRRPATLVRQEVGQIGFERRPKPLRQFGRRDAEPLQVVDDRLLKVGRLPTHRRVVRPRRVVGAAVIDVLADAATSQFAKYTLAGQRLAAERAGHEAAAERELGTPRAPVATVQNVLAGVERGAIDEAFVLPLEHLAVAAQFADVEPIVQNV